MRLLQKKLKNKKGFTLIEMLVVVASIAILVAISVPMVSGALEKARESADAANLQAAKSVALVAEMTGKIDGLSTGADVAADTYFYDVDTGKLSTATPDASDAPQANANKTSGGTTNDSIIVTFNSNKKIVDGPRWGDYS